MLSTRSLLFHLKNSVRCMSSQNNIISSKAKDVKIPKISLSEYMKSSLGKSPKKTAVTCLETKKSYTYSEIIKKSLALTEFLRNSLKLRNKQKVFVFLPNTPEYAIVFLGVAQAGLCISTCNPTYTYLEMQTQIADSNSELVFTSSDLLPIVEKAIRESHKPIKIVEISKNNTYSSSSINFEQITSGPPSTETIEIQFDDILAMPYSSGTTGLPKGVELTNHNLVANLCQMLSPDFELVDVHSSHQDVVPAFLPFFHIYGMTVIMLNTLQTGNKIVTIPQFNLNNFMTLLKDYKPTVLYAVPLMINFITYTEVVKPEYLQSLKCILSGAAPLGAADADRFMKKTNNSVVLLQGYGMTETSPVALQCSTILPGGNKVGGSGLVYPNTQMKIVAPDGISTEGLGPNVSGELLVKGPQVMKRYHNKPEATKETITEDGWLRTGDISYYDEDEHFFITDRLKELIKVKGFQVAPAELEEILRGHPDVVDAAVVSVPHAKSGEAPKAFVVLRKGSVVKGEEIQSFVADKVAKYKRLKGGVVFVDAIPKNASGKILRKVLKTMV